MGRIGKSSLKNKRKEIYYIYLSGKILIKISVGRSLNCIKITFPGFEFLMYEKGVIRLPNSY